MIRFDQSVCADLARARKLEWLETNGLGGFSSSTIVGLNTRRYHGLLTAATRPPVGRLVLLSKFEETLLVGGNHYDLSSNQYAGAVYPEGHRYLMEFRLNPFPEFSYRAGGVNIEKRIFMVHGENCVVIEYEVTSPAGAANCSLELRPLIAFRDYHATVRHNDAIDRTVRTSDGVASVTPYAGLPALFFAHNAAVVEESGNWYFNFEYSADQERGFDEHEDLFNPMVLRFSSRNGITATVIASVQPHHAAEASEMRLQESQRRKNVVARSPSPNPLIQQLTAAADQFIVRRGELNSVVAGYHWFGDWGRDTMISLPGLTLVTGRPAIARNILEAFTQIADRGMLPNWFPDAGESPEYNSVDATLWLFEAVRSYLHYTGDLDFIRDRLYAKLNEILDWYLGGTRHGIHADSDGLLACGESGVQLTWMDSRIGDWVVTPRTGKPVEVQALWYNALRTLQDFAHEFGDSSRELFLGELSMRVRESFNARFWNADAACLYDAIDHERRDASIRPNQIFAVSLHHRMLSPEKELKVVALVERELLTPLGLRSLSPQDPDYRPRYEGGVRERDSAYHQGTVWTWLMGPFISAHAKVHGRTEEAREQAERWFTQFGRQLQTAGLGQISEIADGEPPHEVRGCIAQAWSVAELLRAAVEDIYEIPISKPGEEPG
jgi:predicted glycogen debranching enzyme